MLMLPFEDRKRLASGFEIDACFVPRMFAVIAAIDEQVQHRAVGEFFLGSGRTRACVAQIVAVGGAVAGVASDCADVFVAGNAADVIAVGDLRSRVVIQSKDTAGSGAAIDLADVIAIADRYRIIDRVGISDNSSNRTVSACVGYRTEVGAVFNQTVNKRTGNAASATASCRY